MPSDYISDQLRERQGDMIWRLPRRDGSELYLILMLEHQSTNDAHMALRLLTYRGLLYELLLRHKRIKPGCVRLRRISFRPGR